MQYNSAMLRTLRKNIGKNIHKLRKRKRMPLKKLARITGIDENMLDQYELGKNEIKLDELLKISCVFEVGVERMVGG